MMQRIDSEQRGVTLLLAVLFLTAGLSISLGIFYIVFVQLQINRGARDSHLAFYAADTAKECAGFYREYFGNPSERGFWSPNDPCGGDCIANAPVCAGLAVRKVSDSSQGVDYTPGTPPVGPGLNVQGTPHFFKFQLDKSTTLCADVEIEVLERRVGGVPDIAILTQVNGVSSCDSPYAVNRSFVECLTYIAGGSCEW